MLTILSSTSSLRRQQQGTTLLEVLVTLVILTFGLLGLAGLQAQILIAELEAFQRAQAVLLMNDMIDRISANRTYAASYVTTTPLGTGNAPTVACNDSTLTTEAMRDQCEWGNSLLGASERNASNNKVGGLVNGVGCVELVTAENAAAGICQPGAYRVTVAWQGSNLTSIPSVSCGTGLFGNERYRRAVSSQISIGLPSCQ